MGPRGGYAGAARWPRSLPHHSCRGAECFTKQGVKRLVVERLNEKDKRTARQGSGPNCGRFPAGDNHRLGGGRYLSQPCLHFMAFLPLVYADESNWCNLPPLWDLGHIHVLPP